MDTDVYAECNVECVCGKRIEVPRYPVPSEIVECSGCLTDFEVMTPEEYRDHQSRDQENGNKPLVLGPFNVNDVLYRLVELSEEDGLGE